MKYLLLILFTAVNLYPQFGSQDSGGKLLPEQKCYDVKFYELDLNIDPAEKAVGGSVIIKAAAVENLNRIALDLDTTFTIDMVTLISGESDEKDLNFLHQSGKIWVDFPSAILKGNDFTLRVYYAGLPRVANRPPWDDGFIWKKTKDGTDWVSLACQGGGADIWFPCKDHPSDEPDSVSLHFTVPQNLVCVGSGKFISKKENPNGTSTWNWFVSTPINNYSIMFYLGPYIPLDYDYTSITGEKIPFTVWVLPESFEKAKLHAPQFVQHMKINEELVGPYPFRNDKYAVVESPHLGMEHQTAIAYGFGWKNHKDFEFDWLHHHEFSHEWWGNLVTAKDWSDFWIHEGTGTYMQPLYLEKVFGYDKYIGYLRSIKNFVNKQPIAPRGERTSGESYTLDIYYKGAWILHTLRHYLGDQTFMKVFRKWAYPTEEMEKTKSGGQCRLATTDEFLEIAEKISGKELGWFWEVFMRNSPLPKLHYKVDAGKLKLRWETIKDIPFFLPVDVKIDDAVTKVDMKGGHGEIDFNEDPKFVIDPDEWILMEKVKDE